MTPAERAAYPQLLQAIQGSGFFVDAATDDLIAERHMSSIISDSLMWDRKYEVLTDLGKQFVAKLAALYHEKHQSGTLVAEKKAKPRPTRKEDEIATLEQLAIARIAIQLMMERRDVLVPDLYSAGNMTAVEINEQTGLPAGNIHHTLSKWRRQQRGGGQR